MPIIAFIVWLIVLAIPIYGLFTANKAADKNHGRGAARTNAGTTSTA